MKNILSNILTLISILSGITGILSWLIPNLSLHQKIYICMIVILIILIIFNIKLLIKYKKVKKELRQSNKNRKGLEQNIKEYQHFMFQLLMIQMIKLYIFMSFCKN